LGLWHFFIRLAVTREAALRRWSGSNFIVVEASSKLGININRKNLGRLEC